MFNFLLLFLFQSEIEMDTSLSFLPDKTQRIFQFSYVSTELAESLTKKIERLHGKAIYPVRDAFIQNCTHLIIQQFSATERVLAALAAGLFVFMLVGIFY